MEQTSKIHISTARSLGQLMALCMIVFLTAISSADAADTERARRVLMISTGSRFAPGFGLVEQKTGI